MRIYFKHARMHIKRAMEYRASFYMRMFSQVFTPFSSLLVIYFMFERFGSLSGWRFEQVLLCYSITYLTYGIAECFARGFDLFSSNIRTGRFDRMLLQPKSAVLLTFCSDFELTRFSKTVFAVSFLVYSALNAGIIWSPLKVLTLGMMIFCGVLVFMGLFIGFAAMCFVTIEGLEVANIFTDGGRELSSYPLDIYEKPVTKFFSFVVPFGAFNYLPLLFLLDKAPVINALSPLLAIPFFIACVAIFNAGVKKYRSVGS